MKMNTETKLKMEIQARSGASHATKSGMTRGAVLIRMLVSAVLCTSWAQVKADGLASDYDSLPPLISTAGANDRPNVLLMLDTSGSMDYDTTDEDDDGEFDYVGPNHKTSRTVMARQAIGTLLDRFGETVRMGLMAFEPAPSFDYERSGTSPGQYWAGRNLGTLSNYAINLGYLYIPIGSVNPNDSSASTVARINEFRNRLGLDIVSQPAPTSGYYNLFTLDNTYYTSSTDYANDRLVSNGGTPIAGTFRSALQYKNGSLSSSLYHPDISSADSAWPTDNICDEQDYAILITDGLPSVNIAGAAGNERVDEFMPEVEVQARALRAAGVQTYVIGFAIASGTEYLERMAVAGGTDQAYFADDVSQLTAVLDNIFIDIINRTSSGTGAAVVANRGNGLSADFQALYTPEKTYGGRTVKWVGTLQGFFIDENRLLREDTNQDGLLGSYTVDRIIDFVYDSDSKTTTVDRMISTSATDPTQIDTGATITSAIEDIASIWSARNQLAAINDVLFQRPYSSPANTGRRIYTTTDGQTLLNFMQIDPDDLNALEQDEDTLRDNISTLEDEIYGGDSNPTDFDLNDLQTELDNTNNLILLTDDLDGIGEGDLLDAALAVQQEIESVRAATEADIATQRALRDSALTTEAEERADLTQAQSDLAAQQSELDAAQASLDQAELDQTAANQALADAVAALAQAESDRDAAQQALTDSQAAQATAQSERDTAAAAVTTAEGDVATEQSDFDTAEANRDTASSDLNQANDDYSAALSDRDDAQSAYDSAVTSAGEAKSEADAAASDLAQANADLTTAQDALADAQATYPPMHPAIAAAEADVAAAQSAYDVADDAYNTEYQEFQDALDTVDTRDNERTAAQGALNTATTNRSAAQSTYAQAVSDYNSAQSDLSAAQGVLTAAQSDLASKETTLTDANADAATKASELTAAQTAVTEAAADRAAATTARDTADTVVADATAARDAEQADVTAATQVVADAQSDYDAATAARELVDDDLSYLNGLVDKLDAAAAWTDQLLAAADRLRELLGYLSSLGNADAAARSDLLAQIDAIFNELQTLIAGQPDLGINAGLGINTELTNLQSLLDSLNTEIVNVAVLVDDQNAADPLDSIAEIVADIDSKMTQKEAYEAALNEVNSQINSQSYIQYMDDNISGQVGDTDLTYAQRSDIVGWIRGEEITGLRNRTIDYDEDGDEEVWRLADIVNSTPVVVGRPTGLYYSRYGDTTYRNYLNAKFNRRQVVYAGSNDGMLHAFNSGFWDDSQKGYVTQLSGDTSVAHPLGTELWAFIPKAALPHLQFVANTNYAHMALVDGAPQTFDVNIFPNDADHPNGWGTILVVNMRLGGGPFTVRVDDDGDGTDEDVVIRPSVFIFDVTNPEVEPTLIAEISHPEIGYTFGKAALIKNRVASATSGSWSDPAVNEWMLVFGSGPTELDTATSTQQARLYAYDLKEKEWASDWSAEPMVLNLESNAFTGDATSEDWDRDYVDDAVYFGLNTGTAAATDGRVARLRLRSDQGAGSWLSAASIGTLVDVQRSVIGSPLTKADIYGRRWVYFGTGRVLVGSDNANSQQQYFYGVKEPINTDYDLTYGAVSTGTLLDISNIRVFTNPDSIENGPSGVDTPAELIAYMNENNEGWVRSLTDSGTVPSGRSDTSPITYLESVTFSEYIPSDDQCNPEGESYVWSIDYVTGVASKEYYLDSTVINETTGLTEILASTLVGDGKAGELTTLPDGNLVMHDSTGRVIIIDATKGNVSLRRQSWRQIFNIGF
ncbi:hypothetical protein [Ketobacter alkanivorans]|uniref:VWFA domain-containing protein n=1 Tax=Ketobacter alkanivorans TaxID=1917421 RepID=A0A2K9LI94_9GAMM|nr:hypothetical protein [Ketobacter alkanivorans]AUM11960.1 hypothetical protein Kalk_05775 [Ketobacter alkanivorans]